jgi:membrane-associated protease RseP (regulator of RpoE activity)
MELVGIAVFIFGLIASIALHELGHLVPAKRFGATVPEFMVGFGPVLWSRRFGATTYGFRAVPLGGFVRILGMYAPAADGRRTSGPFAPAVHAARKASAEEVEASDATAFWQLSAMRRIIVMLGGPLVNLVLGLLLATIALAGIGVASPSRTIDSVSTCTTASCETPQPGPAALAGVEAGDQLVRIGTTEISQWSDVTEALTGLEPGEIVAVHVLRSGVERKIEVRLGARPDGSGAFLGVGPGSELRRIAPEELPTILGSFVRATVVGVLSFPARVGDMIGAALGEVRDPSSPVGVIGVARIGGDFAASGGTTAEITVSMLLLLAGLNLSLFAFNLVPLLPLDGGHVAGVLFESVRNRFRAIRGVKGQPVDVARMLPLTYGVTLVLISLSLLLAFADLINPIKL